MPVVYFSHPNVNEIMGGPLAIETGANQITWGYGLNYKTTPTYGGEVVQILSAYTDDLEVQGEVAMIKDRTDAQGQPIAGLERIYKWFLSYLQIATQNSEQADGISPFNQQPILFTYPERGWAHLIQVKELPGFRYGREQVVPEYRIRAHVVVQDDGLNDLIKEKAHLDARQKQGFDVAAFDRVSAGIGYVKENPFSDPFPNVSPDLYDEKTRDMYKQLGDYFTSFIQSYTTGDFNKLLGDNQGSYPAFLAGGTATPGSATNESNPSKQEKNTSK